MLTGARLLFRSRGFATATRRTSKRLDGALSLENVRPPMTRLCRLYTYIPPPPPRYPLRTSGLNSGALYYMEILITSFVQFLQRSRTLAFYRTILRGIKRIQDPTTKAESKKYARDEFERHRNVTDLVRSSFPLVPFSITAFNLYISGNPGDPSANTQAAVPYQIPIINRQDRVGDNGALYRPHVKEKKNLREENTQSSSYLSLGL